MKRSISSHVSLPNGLLHGRHFFVMPGHSGVKHLCCSRITLCPSEQPVDILNEGRETGIICLAGHAVVKLHEILIALDAYDALYAPSDERISIHTNSHAVLVEFSADTSHRSSVQIIRHSEL